MMYTSSSPSTRNAGSLVSLYDFLVDALFRRPHPPFARLPHYNSTPAHWRIRGRGFNSAVPPTTRHEWAQRLVSQDAVWVLPPLVWSLASLQEEQPATSYRRFQVHKLIGLLSPLILSSTGPYAYLDGFQHVI